jgi:deoxyadenosine/deoxycytidine kinase/NTP pyrophosphatase (non-canonical NTP hydrolase)
VYSDLGLANDAIGASNSRLNKERILKQGRSNNSPYIVIEGAIGVGKTTLTRMLSDHLQASDLLEVFEENPFLSKFYESRARYAFQTQMFFLLSRYKQQQQQIPSLLEQGTLVADYMFAKDWLFARLNLTGDEWDVYQQIHAALAEQIIPPDLVVYLKASTDTLMGRIAQRDRPYERDMDREYIDHLRRAYDRYFETNVEPAVLVIDTDPVNFVTRPADFERIVKQIRDAVRDQVRSPGLEQHDELDEPRTELRKGQPLNELQQFHVELDQLKDFDTDVYFNYLCLSEEIGELGSELAQLWRKEHLLKAKGIEEKQARETAMNQYREEVQSELADCMAYLLKLANYANIDLETAYLAKMSVNQERTWIDG